MPTSRPNTRTLLFCLRACRTARQPLLSRLTCLRTGERPSQALNHHIDRIIRIEELEESVRGLEYECKKKTSQLAQANIDIRHLAEKSDSAPQQLAPPSDAIPSAVSAEATQAPAQPAPLEPTPAAAAPIADPLGAVMMMMSANVELIPHCRHYAAIQRQAELEAQVALLTQKLAEAQSDLADSTSRNEHEKAELKAQLFEAQREKPAPHADSAVIDADASSHSTIARLEASVKRLKAAAETAVGAFALGVKLW